MTGKVIAVHFLGILRRKGEFAVFYKTDIKRFETVVAMCDSADTSTLEFTFSGSDHVELAKTLKSTGFECRLAGNTDPGLLADRVVSDLVRQIALTFFARLGLEIAFTHDPDYRNFGA